MRRRDGRAERGAVRGLVVALAVTLGVGVAVATTQEEQRPVVTVGSKAFTESVILGEIAAALLGNAGGRVEHRRELGGSRILWNALLAGEIDVYPEYTGTISQEILAGEEIETDSALRAALDDRGLRLGGRLGFDNSYVIGMRESLASELGIRELSDLGEHPDLSFGFSNEFMDRADGWPALRRRYGLPQRDVRGLDHDLAYRGIASGSIDAVDLYSTDAEIRYYDLRPLEDDLDHFPEYAAVLLYRADLASRFAAGPEAMARLEGVIDAAEMRRMNGRVKLQGDSEARVAAEFVERELGVSAEVEEATMLGRLLRNLRTHLILVVVSLAAAIVVAVPLGVAAWWMPRAGQLILGTVGIVQTVPSLAMFVFMIPLLGIGARPAIMALFLYSLLPIVRNTHSGLADIPGPVRESAEALGLPRQARLRLVELPLAARSILAGIKTSAVINVGTATLAALIGAEGFGQPILTGIRLADTGLIMQGAIPAALLALAAQGVFELAERWLVPRGLRLAPERS